MKVYEGLDAEGRLVYFEVPNMLFTRRAAYKLVSSVPGVSVTSSPGFWPFGRDEVFCKFELDDGHFELWEPFGDNSRFHVAAKPLGPSTALQQLRAVFQAHRPISGAVRWLIVIGGIALVCFRLFAP